MEKIVEGVYVQVVENKKVVQKYVPLPNVFLKDNKTLGEYLEQRENEYERLKIEVEALKDNIRELSQEFNRLETIYEDTIRGFVSK